jgi:hypothetical protein
MSREACEGPAHAEVRPVDAVFFLRIAAFHLTNVSVRISEF